MSIVNKNGRVFWSGKNLDEAHVKMIYKIQEENKGKKVGEIATLVTQKIPISRNTALKYLRKDTKKRGRPKFSGKK